MWFFLLLLIPVAIILYENYCYKKEVAEIVATIKARGKRVYEMNEKGDYVLVHDSLPKSYRVDEAGKVVSVYEYPPSHK